MSYSIDMVYTITLPSRKFNAVQDELRLFALDDPKLGGAHTVTCDPIKVINSEAINPRIRRYAHEAHGMGTQLRFVRG